MKQLYVETGDYESQQQKLQQVLRDLRSVYPTEDRWDISSIGTTIRAVRGWRDGFKISLAICCTPNRSELCFKPTTRADDASQEIFLSLDLVCVVIAGLGGILGICVAFVNYFMEWWPILDLWFRKLTLVTHLIQGGILGIVPGALLFCAIRAIRFLVFLLGRTFKLLPSRAGLDKSRLQLLTGIVAKTLGPVYESDGYAPQLETITPPPALKEQWDFPPKSTSKVAGMTCPKCGVRSQLSSRTCECGYTFARPLRLSREVER